MTDQNETTPIADNNSVTNDSTKADTNEQGIPKARLDEVVAQRHKATERGDSYKSQLEELQALKLMQRMRNYQS